MHSRKMTTSCPYCQHKYDAYADALSNQTRKAKDGDVSFCIMCGKVGIFKIENITTAAKGGKQMEEKIIETDESQLNTFQLLAIDKIRETWKRIKENQK